MAARAGKDLTASFRYYDRDGSISAEAKQIIDPSGSWVLLDLTTSCSFEHPQAQHDHIAHSTEPSQAWCEPVTEPWCIGRLGLLNAQAGN